GDGDEDLALAGRTATGLVTGVYRNEGGQLVDISAGLPGLEQGSIEWIDLDGDADLDLTVSGALESGRLVTQIYRNDAGQFTRIEAELPGVLYGTATWSDYDGDGDPDLLIAGGLYGPELIEGFTQLYRNDAGALTPVDAGLTPIANGNAEWGDYDGDGDPDLLLAGPANVVDARTYRIRVFKNEAGTFRQVFEESGLALGEATWWDYTGNGTLDILSVGQDNNGRPRTDLYRVIPRQF
ncbi:MAG: FG-GAP-like repeat-containing protein, partial [Bacteroidota bacterium]